MGQKVDPGLYGTGKPMRRYSCMSSNTKAWKLFASNIPRAFPRIWNRGNSSKSAISTSRSSSGSSSALGLSGSISCLQAAQLLVLPTISWKQRRWKRVRQLSVLRRRWSSLILKSAWHIKQTPSLSSSDAKFCNSSASLQSHVHSASQHVRMMKCFLARELNRRSLNFFLFSSSWAFKQKSCVDLCFLAVR